ncbi:MAG: YIP1 family protein [Bacteroidetes bacterium]|nr:YIP1 family protein [Bacteroidota bacterium]
MTAEAPAPVEPLSLTDKFIGILTEPAPTYENVRTTGSRTSDWLVPILLLMIVIAGATLARFSNPEFSAQIMQQQTQALHKAVDAGDMTQEQADQAERQIRSMSGFFGIFGAIAGAIGYFILFFIIALFYWLIVRFLLRGDATYTLVLSAVGLASFISILDQLVSLLLTYLTGKAFANLSPVLFMDVDIINAGFGSKILMLLNPITIWATWVTGIGLEKVGRISRVKGMIAAFSLWIIFTLLTLSMGSMGMG